jgi:hypothetical protein
MMVMGQALTQGTAAVSADKTQYQSQTNAISS